MFSIMKAVLLVYISVLMTSIVNNGAEAKVPENVLKNISRINEKGPYLGVVVPNNFEMSPLLQSPSFTPDDKLPYLDFAGKRFRLGYLKNEKVIIVMTGLGMLNAGITTQLLLSLFKIKGIAHFGIAGNANPALQIGDVTIPMYWAHTGLWNWQKYGDGPDDQLALEANGDYTRRIGYLKFSGFDNDAKNGSLSDNTLNRVWYQPEEIFPIDGSPEVRQHAFWVPVNKHYFSLAKKLEGMKNMERCVNLTCLPRAPVVTRVERGISANVFVDNAAYREFVYAKFNATPIDMESAAVALVSLQQKKPFIAIRSLSDLAGGGSGVSNEADIFSPLAARNAVNVLLRFIALLSST